MPIRRLKVQRRRLMLFPLMDMFFILLLYFLVTAGYSPTKPLMQATDNKTAFEGTPELQILLQIVSPNEILWLDITSFEDGYTGAALRERRTVQFSKGQLNINLRSFYENNPCPGDVVMCGIRCPDNLDYGLVGLLQDDLLKLDEAIPVSLKPIQDIKLTFSISAGDITDIDFDAINQIDAGHVEISWE